MKVKNSLYAYPVLSLDDEDYNEGSEFYASYTFQEATAFKPAVVQAKFHLENQELQLLIDEGKAAFYLHVESPATFYRKIVEVENGSLDVEIDVKVIRKKVEFTAFLLVKESIENFTNNQVNMELFGENYVFPILEKGAPLALGFTETLELEEKDDFQSLSSILIIAQTEKSEYSIDYDQEKIFVYLPEAQYLNYRKYASVFGEVLFSSIITPVLLYVFEAMEKTRGDELEEYQWYKVIIAKMESFGFEKEQLYNGEVTSFALVQKILENPLERMFSELEGVDLDNG
jgi:hypothetical protein